MNLSSSKVLGTTYWPIRATAGANEGQVSPFRWVGNRCHEANLGTEGEGFAGGKKGICGGGGKKGIEAAIK
jgi:hypothetical protein